MKDLWTPVKRLSTGFSVQEDAKVQQALHGSRHGRGTEVLTPSIHAACLRENFSLLVSLCSTNQSYIPTAQLQEEASHRRPSAQLGGPSLTLVSPAPFTKVHAESDRRITHRELGKLRVLGQEFSDAFETWTPPTVAKTTGSKVDYEIHIGHPESPTAIRTPVRPPAVIETVTPPKVCYLCLSLLV